MAETAMTALEIQRVALYGGFPHKGTKTLTAILGFTKPIGSYVAPSLPIQGSPWPSNFGGDRRHESPTKPFGDRGALAISSGPFAL